jgi:hypothetical protein
MGVMQAGPPIALRVDELLFGDEKLAIPAYVLLVVSFVITGFFKSREHRIFHSILLPDYCPA